MNEPVGKLHIDSELLRRLSIADYHRMIEAGVIREDDHVELLEGMIIAMPPQGVPHAKPIQRLTSQLVKLLPDAYVVRPQLPLTLESSEPEPDIAVVTADEAARADTHPRAALLVIEVAAESLQRDREIKGAIYARAGIPEYWIVDVVGRVVEVYRDPDPAGRYRSLATLGPSARLDATSLPGVSIAVDALFG